MKDEAQDKNCCVSMNFNDPCGILRSGPTKFPTCNVLIEPAYQRQRIRYDESSTRSYLSDKLVDGNEWADNLGVSSYAKNQEIGYVLEKLLANVEISERMTDVDGNGEAGGVDREMSELEELFGLKSVPFFDGAGDILNSILKYLPMWSRNAPAEAVEAGMRESGRISIGNLSKKDIALLDVSTRLLIQLLPLLKHVGMGSGFVGETKTLGRALLEIVTRPWKEAMEGRLETGEAGGREGSEWTPRSSETVEESTKAEEDKSDGKDVGDFVPAGIVTTNNKDQNSGFTGSGRGWVREMLEGSEGKSGGVRPSVDPLESYDSSEVQKLEYQAKLDVIRTLCPHLAVFEPDNVYGVTLVDMIFDYIVSNYRELLHEDKEGLTGMEHSLDELRNEDVEGRSAGAFQLAQQLSQIKGAKKLGGELAEVVVEDSIVRGPALSQNRIGESYPHVGTDVLLADGSSYDEPVKVSELSTEELMFLVITGIHINKNYLNNPRVMRNALLEMELRGVQTTVQMMNTRMMQLKSPGYADDKQNIGLNEVGRLEAKGAGRIEDLTTEELERLLNDEVEYAITKRDGVDITEIDNGSARQDGGFRGSTKFGRKEIENELEMRAKIEAELRNRKDVLLNAYYDKLKSFYATCQDSRGVEYCPQNIEDLLNDMLTRLEEAKDKLDDPNNIRGFGSETGEELTSKGIIENLVHQILELSGNTLKGFKVPEEGDSFESAMLKLAETESRARTRVNARTTKSGTKYKKRNVKHITAKQGRGAGVNQVDFQNVPEEGVSADQSMSMKTLEWLETVTGKAEAGSKTVLEASSSRRLNLNEPSEDIASLALINNVVIDEKSKVIGIFHPDTNTISNSDGTVIGYASESGQVVIHGIAVGMLGAAATENGFGLYQAVPRLIQQGTEWRKEASKDTGTWNEHWRGVQQPVGEAGYVERGAEGSSGKEIRLLSVDSDAMVKGPELVMSGFLPHETEISSEPVKRGPRSMLEELLNFENLAGSETKDAEVETVGVKFLDVDGKLLGELRSDGSVVDSSGTLMGRMRADGSLDAEIETLFKGSVIVDDQWLVIGKVNTSGVVQAVVDEDRYLIGSMRNDGRIFSLDGSLIGSVTRDGRVLAPNSVMMGRLTSNWQLIGRDEVPFAYITSQGKIYRYDVLRGGATEGSTRDITSPSITMENNAPQATQAEPTANTSITKSTSEILKSEGDRQDGTGREERAAGSVLPSLLDIRQDGEGRDQRAAVSVLPSLLDIIEDVGGMRTRRAVQGTDGTDLVAIRKYKDTLSPESIVRLLSDLNYKMGAVMNKSKDAVGKHPGEASVDENSGQSGLELESKKVVGKGVGVEPEGEIFRLPSYLSVSERSSLARSMAVSVVDDLFKFALTHLLLQAEAGDDTDRIMDCLARIETFDETDDVAQAMWRPAFHQSYHKLSYDRSKPFYLPPEVENKSVIELNEVEEVEDLSKPEIEVKSEEEEEEEEKMVTTRRHHRHHHRHHRHTEDVTSVVNPVEEEPVDGGVTLSKRKKNNIALDVL